MDKDFMLNYYDKMVRPIWTELMKTSRYQRVACERDKIEREFRRLLDEKLGRKYLELDDAPQITVDVNILTMLKQAASCLTEAAGKDVYLAAIGPDMELTIIMEEDAPSVLPCFDEEDALIAVKGAPLFISYNPAQVLKLADKRYLTGPVIFYRTDGHSTIVSLTVEDIYRFQTYLASHSITLMADDQKLPCICID